MKISLVVIFVKFKRNHWPKDGIDACLILFVTGILARVLVVEYRHRFAYTLLDTCNTIPD